MIACTMITARMIASVVRVGVVVRPLSWSKISSARRWPHCIDLGIIARDGCESSMRATRSDQAHCLRPRLSIMYSRPGCRKATSTLARCGMSCNRTLERASRDSRLHKPVTTSCDILDGSKRCLSGWRSSLIGMGVASPSVAGWCHSLSSPGPDLSVTCADGSRLSVLEFVGC